MTDRSRLQNRLELLGTCAMIAVAIGIANSSESFAQSALQGTPTVAAGDAGITSFGPSGGAAALDTISLNSQTAIINWTTFDQTTNTPIDFLPQNTIARFQSANQDFVVLNRVFAATPGQAISLNGTVQSLNFSSQTTGSVWFYSPGGIIAGPTSVFNVGNLILTADDIDTTSGLFGSNNTIRFRGSAGSTSAITIQPGAQINLTAAGSYLALVAPQVTMGGTATVNGSTAYIAAEQVDVRINGGAFDIAFLAGTGVANALTHSGTTTGPAAANGTIAMAAMPKNTAITMLVGGTVGYTPAATATVQNGTVVLSAGQDVAFGFAGQTPSATAANLTLGSGTFGSQVNATATNIVASPNGGGPLSFTGNVALTGLTSAEVRADAGEVITVGGDLTVASRRPGVGGTARLIADGAGARISIGGVTRVDASAVGIPTLVGAGGNAVGGTAELLVTGGSATLGEVLVLADGDGGPGSTQSGNGTGGIARVVAQPVGANAAFAAGDFTVSASGIGAGPGQVLNERGGNGTGGSASFAVGGNGASTGQTTIRASGLGGGGDVLGGDASGGTARLSVTGSGLTANLVTVDAWAQAGGTNPLGTSGSTNATGLAEIVTNNAVLTSMGFDVNASSFPTGSVPGISGSSATSGASRGGRARLSFTDSIVSTGSGRTTISAQANTSYISGSTSIVAGGTAEFFMSGGTFQTNQLDIDTRAIGGASIGGNTLFALTNNAALTTSTVNLTAWAAGFTGANPAPARGGDIDITLTDATVSGLIAADANGDGGYNTTGLIGGSGTGGTIDLLMQGNSSASSLNLRADGGTPGEPRGGYEPGAAPVHLGGRVSAILSGGTVNGDVLLSATGLGLSGGGTGTGGNATLTLSGGTISGELAQVFAMGIGAAGIDGDFELGRPSTSGGGGVGGTALLDLVSGTISSSTVTIDASGIGGDGGTGSSVDGANGGLGRGGSAGFRSVGASVLDNAASPTVRARGEGGQGGRGNYAFGPSDVSFVGGNGGSSFGGTATIDWNGNALSPGSLFADAAAIGGDGARGYDNAPGFTGDTGGQGGDALGGTATIFVSGPSTQFVGIAARADASGGDGATGNSTLRGGDATGGTAQVRVVNAPLVVGELNISSSAESGLTETGRFATGLRGGDATGGTGSFEVTGAGGSYVASTGGQFASAGIPVFTLSAEAIGTSGIAGRSGTSGGAGGRGGNATAGQVTVRALDGLIDLSGNTLTGFDVSAAGGDAGNGGNASTYQPTGGGAGGDAGNATGGTITLAAEGGRVITGNLALASNALAGTFGSGGVDAGRPASPGVQAIAPTVGATGAMAFGTGGTIAIDTRTSGVTGVDGRITTGSLTADVAGQTNGYTDYGYAGSVSITNTNTGGGALRLGALTVEAGSPTSGLASGSTSFNASNAPIVVDGDIRVTGSTNVDIRASGAGSITAGGLVNVDVQGNFGASNSGGTGQPALQAASIAVSAGSGIDTQSALIRADTDITLSTLGSISAGGLTAGRDIRTTVTTGNISLGPITAGRNLLISASPTTSTITVGDATVGGFLEARGAILGFGNVTAGTDAILSSFNGGLSVGNVTAGDDIFLTVNGSFANPNTVSPDSQTGVVSTTINPLVAGNLRSTGLGNDTAASGPRTFTGAGPTGNVIRVRATGAVQAGSIATSGTAIVVSDLASLATGAISAPSGVGLYVRGNATVGDITTAGTFWLGDSSQVFGFVPTYTVINFAPFQTPTSGGASLGAVQAGLIRGSVLTDTVYGSITATGDLLWSTGNSTIVGGNVTGSALTTGGTMTVRAGGELAFTTATSQGSALLTAGTGSVTGTAIVGQSSIDVSARTAITIPTVTTPGPVNLGAAFGDVRVATNLQSTAAVLGAGQSIFARSTGALTITNMAAAAGSIDVAADGNLVVGQARARGDIALISAANLTADTVDAGYDVTVQTSGFSAEATLTGANVTTGTSVGSGRSLTVNATNTATINGTTLGRFETAINSADIVIGTGATLGGIGNRLTLTNTGQGQTFVGDLTGTGGWRLDAAEIGRILAHDVSILAPVVGGPASTVLNSARAPDVTIGSFTATGGQQLGGESIFGIQTAGKVRVTGAATFTALRGDTTVAIRGDEAIEILDAGRITMNDANGLAGTLELTSRNIVASSSAALADFGNATSLTAISDRAGRNDGAANDGGYLQAGGIRATLLNSTLIIQNTGTSITAGNKEFAARRGFTVGAGGFTVVQGGTNLARIVINGRQVITAASGAGGFTTGIELIPLITFVPQQSGAPFTFPINGATAAQIQAAAAAFDPLSTVNGCTIISTGSCGNTIVVNDPIRDVLEGDFGEGSITNLLPISIIQLRDYSKAGDEPLIDEPVTGAGNDDLWSVDDSTKCDPAKEVCR